MVVLQEVELLEMKATCGTSSAPSTFRVGETEARKVQRDQESGVSRVTKREAEGKKLDVAALTEILS